MITGIAELLKAARRGGYAVPAFNVDNLESVMGVLEACKDYPAIVQTIPRTLSYGGVGSYAAMIKSLYNGNADIAIHLDHGGSLDICKSCLVTGYTSIMIDGSALPFDDNVKLTSEAVELAHSFGADVEAELGGIGGKEESSAQIRYTDPEEARLFVKLTGVDALAIGVGSAHGIYKGEPHIDIDRIRDIASVTDVPLVLHGASGLSDEVLTDCIRAGIAKINFATELRQAFTRGLKEGLKLMPDAYDPKQYLPYAVEQVKQVALSKIKVCAGGAFNP